MEDKKQDITVQLKMNLKRKVSNEEVLKKKRKSKSKK